MFLGEAAQEVSEPAQAIALLRGIFKDEVVVIAALQAGRVLFYDLTPAGDSTEDFVRFTGGDYFKAPAVDGVWVRSWSGAGDFGEAPVATEDGEGVEWPDPGALGEEGAGPEWAVEAVEEDEPEAGWGEPIVR